MYLIVIPALFLLIVFFSLRNRGGFGSREAILLTLGAAGVLVVTSTELLSFMGWINRWAIAISWLLFGILGLWLLRRVARVEKSEVAARENTEVGLFWGIGGVILALVALTALNAAPSTWDAMTYHMARVVRWSLQGSLQFYPTNEPQQLFQPPLAEFFMLHLFLLADSDRLVNLVQVIGFGGCAVGASLVARELGARATGQAFGALLVLTLPQGILQASGAKNDCSLALWLIAMVYAALRFLRTERRLWLLATGVFLGLAVLTKGTSYVYGPGLLLGVAGMEWASVKRSWRQLSIAMAVLVLAINAGHYGRNIKLYGSPLGNGYADAARNYSFRNETINVKVLWGNIWRNLGLHAGTPVPSWNAALQASAESVIRMMGEDPQNPKALWYGSRFAIPDPALRESAGANPLHMVLAIGSILWVVLRRRKFNRELLWYATGTSVAFLLFCLLLRWQPWHTRLHFSWFVATAPLAACLFDRMASRALLGTIAGVFVIWAAPAAVQNQARPLAYGASVLSAPWKESLFADAPPFRSSFESIAKKIIASPCRDIAVDSSQLIYLYPLYALLDPLHNNMRIHEVEVANESRSTGDASTRGCATVCLACANVAANKNTVLGKDGWWSDKSGDIILYSSPTGGILREGCGVTFSDGWYARESSGPTWWRWTSKGGKITVTASDAGKLQLTSPLISVPKDNTVSMRWNGKPLPDIAVKGSTLLDLQLDAVAGPNTLEIESLKPGEPIPPDTRTFALQIREMQIKGQKVGVCEIP